LEGADGKWTKLNPAGALPIAGAYYSVAVINNKIYVISGSTYQDTWEYDPSNGTDGTWTNMAAKAPINTYSSASTAYNNKLYIFGGAANKTSIFDPETKNWSQSTYAPITAPNNKTAVTIGNQIYLFGGETMQNIATNELWVYYPDNETWRKLNPLNPPVGRLEHSAAVYNNKMYIWAGLSENTQNNGFLNDLWVYDPVDGAEGSWQEIIPNGIMPLPRKGSSLTNMNGDLYIFGGYSPPRGDIYRYEP
jgi:N-acetylneuraminic acid mutarotase